jgi:hypothetical protein
MIWGVNPNLTSQQVEDILEQSCDGLGNDLVFGHGRVNLYKAVIAAQPGLIWVDFAYVGAEAGTFLQPYSRLTIALAAAPNASTIMMKAGSTTETPTIGQAGESFTLKAFGGTATVGVGAASSSLGQSRP